VKPVSVNNHKKKCGGRIKLLVAIGVFTAVFLTSTAYALSSGWIVMQGVVSRTENIDVRFANARFVGEPRIGEFVVISSADNQRSFTITAQLMMPGDSREVSFQVINTGNQAIRLLDIQTVQDDPSVTGLMIQWPDENPNSPSLTNYLLVSGATSDTFRIRIEWDANVSNAPTGLFNTFTLTMNYQNALLPIGGV
jgi:hypothetical protein